MKKYKLTAILMIMLMLLIVGCEEEDTVYPPKTNRLEVTLGLPGDYDKTIVAKEGVQVVEDPTNVFTFTATDIVDGTIVELWTLRFQIDPTIQDQVLLISDNNYNSIRFDTPPTDDGIGNYFIEKGDLNDDITTITITKFIPGEEIQGEFFGNIHELNTSSNDSLKSGFFHTNNFVNI